jgi:maleylacetate reductase
MEFAFQASPTRVLFGKGMRARVGEELDRLGVARAMVVTTPSRGHIAGEFARLIGERAGIVYPGAQLHTPFQVTEAALTAVSSVKADGLLVIGGGTAMGMSKMIALRTDLPQVIVPVTFSGSEMSPSQAELERGVKVRHRSAKILPETVIYDPELVKDLPPGIAGPSALNGLAHAVEALYAPDANPLTSAVAEEGVRALGQALPSLGGSADDATWEKALYGAWLAGSCLSMAGMGIHHQLCHAVSGMFLDLSHAEIHGVLLPYTIGHGLAAVPVARKRAARALGRDDVEGAIHELMVGAVEQPSLKAMGLTRAALDKVADAAAKESYDKTKPVSRDQITQMLLAAYEGGPP